MISPPLARMGRQTAQESDKQQSTEKGLTSVAHISAFIICKNEVAALGPCVESLGFCREIVIVDSGSTDGTLGLIENYRERGYPIRLFKREWPGYALQKQFALDQCRHDWCLNLDADERVDWALADVLCKIVLDETGHAAWKIRRREWLPGYGYAHPLVAAKAHIRLARKAHAAYPSESIIHESMNIKGSVGKITTGWLLHFHQASAESDFDKQNRYTTLKAQQRLDRGKKARSWRMLTTPTAYFLNFYLLKRYFLCGWAGLAHAMSSAQYAFQTELKHWRADIAHHQTDTSSNKRS